MSIDEPRLERLLDAIRNGYDRQHELLQLVLYDHPRDLPAVPYVVRAWRVCRDRIDIADSWFGFKERETAERWIEQEFPDLVRLERSPGDDPVIVAVWT